jgi:hypothetical protein
MAHGRPAEGKLMFAVTLEGTRDLVLRDGRGVEKRRLVLSDSTLRNAGADGVAEDLMTSVGYEMKDEQGSEDQRR